MLVTPRYFSRNEKYVAILLDRASQGPVIVASAKGGIYVNMYDYYIAVAS